MSSSFHCLLRYVGVEVCVHEDVCVRELQDRDVPLPTSIIGFRLLVAEGFLLSFSLPTC